MYLIILASDLRRAKRFQGTDADVLRAVVKAVLAGGLAGIEEIKADLLAIAVDVKPLAQGLVESFVADKVKDAVTWGVDAVADAVTGRGAKAKAKKEVGKAFMDLADRMKKT